MYMLYKNFFARNPFNIPPEELKKISENMTIDKFYQLLEKHDWTYDYSDDGSVWRCGTAERDFLKIFIDRHNNFCKLYTDYFNYIFKEADKPQLSKYSGG